MLAVAHVGYACLLSHDAFSALFKNRSLNRFDRTLLDIFVAGLLSFAVVWYGVCGGIRCHAIAGACCRGGRLVSSGFRIYLGFFLVAFQKMWINF